MKKSLALALVLGLSSTMALATPSNANKQQALKTALNFGNSIHCQAQAFNNNPSSSVFVIGGSDGVYDYAVLQFVDLYCSGGSGTGSYILTPVTQQGSRMVVDTSVQPDGNLFDLISHPHLNPGMISSASYNQATKRLTVVNNAYDENDSNSYASKRYQVVIDLNEMAVVSSKRLN